MNKSYSLSSYGATNPIKDFIIYILVAVMYASSIAYAILAPTLVQYSYLQVANICFILLVVLFFLLYNKWTMLVGGFLLLLLFGVLLVLSAVVESFAPISEIMNHIWTHVENIWVIIMGYSFTPDYNFPILLLLGFVCTLYTTIFMRKVFSFLALFLFGAGVFFIEIFFGQMKSPLAFAMFLVSLAILVMTKSAGREKKKQNNKRFGAFAYYVIPACLIAVLFASLITIPAPTEPKGFAETVRKAEIKTLKDVPKLFSFGSGGGGAFGATSGFSEGDVKLGGNLTLDHTPVMEVEAEEPVYLKGVTKDVYTGGMWTSSEDAEDEQDETAGSSYDVDEQYLIHAFVLGQETGWSANQLQLKSIGHPINRLFYPLRAFAYEQDGTFNNINGDTVLYPPLEEGSSITITYTDFSEEQQAYLLSVSEKGLYKNSRAEWNRYDMPESYTVEGAGLQIMTDYADDYVPEDFLEYVDSIYQQYTALPDSIPQRVYDLAQSLTQDEESGYEKMKALENHLRTFTYTLSPGSLPSGRDFVDYFLFDSQRGYCTSFATALCVMGRTLGIPTRYVQGYAMSDSLEGDGDKKGIYTITNAQAHAWTEAYFEGAGWVQFEATAPYASAYYQDGIAASVSPEMQNNPDYQSHLNNIGGDYSVKETEQNQQESPPIGSIWQWGLAILGVVIAGILVYAGILFSRYRKKKRYIAYLKRDVSNQTAAIGYFDEIMKLAAIDGNARHAYETPLAYAKRMHVYYESADELEKTADIYAKARYSKHPVSEEEISISVSCFHKMNQLIEKNVGRRRYLFRYLLAKM